MIAALTLALATKLFPAPPAHVVIVGWDDPITSVYSSRISEYKALPITGVSIKVRLSDGRFPFQTAFSRQALTETDLATAKSDLLAAKAAGGLPDSMLLVNANPGNVDWSSDDDWNSVVNTFRLAARLAKQTGLKGLIFDAEAYTYPYEPFTYLKQKWAASKSLADYQGLVRVRGRAVMQAIAAEYPDITILNMHHLNSIQSLVDSAGSKQVQPYQPVDLLPQFISTMVEKLPATARIVDGNETAFRNNSFESFFRQGYQTKLVNWQILGSIYKPYYDARTALGFGFFLDAYTNPAGSRWTVRSEGVDPGSLLTANLTYARTVGADWIWLYSEKARWLPDPNTTTPTWKSSWANLEQSVASGTQGPLNAITLLTESPQVVKSTGSELLLNRDFSLGEQSWWKWNGGTTGTFSVSSEGASIVGVQQGCYGQLVASTPGKAYLVSGEIWSSGPCCPILYVQWKDSKLAWMPTPDSDRKISSLSSGGGWQKVQGLVTAPAGSSYLGLLLTSSGGTSPTQWAKFRNLSVKEAILGTTP